MDVLLILGACCVVPVLAVLGLKLAGKPGSIDENPEARNGNTENTERADVS